MLTKSINPPLQSTNGFNTDVEIGGQGLVVAVVKTEKGPEQYWVLDSVQYSYRKTVATATIVGGLIVRDGDKIIIDLDIDNSFGNLQFYLPASPGQSLTVSLRSGGAEIFGKLNVQTHLETSA